MLFRTVMRCRSLYLLALVVARLCCFSAVFAPALFAQTPNVRGLDPTKPISEYRHSVWTVDNGLPQNSAQALCQTRDGYLWIGTQEGLVRFDGLNFKVFDKNNAPAITDKYINALLETKDGALWGGGYNGCLFSMRNGVFEKHLVEETAETSVLAELRGRVWIGTSAGLYCWERGNAKLRRFTTADGLPNNAILSLAADTARNILWVGTQSGLVRIESINIIRPEKSITTPMRSLLLDSKGLLWMGTSKGLQQGYWNNHALTIQQSFTTRNGLSDNIITALFEDNERTLWIGTATQGLMRRTQYSSVFETYQVKDGLTSNGIDAILQDNEGAVWIGNQVGGMNRLGNSSFTSYTKDIL